MHNEKVLFTDILMRWLDAGNEASGKACMKTGMRGALIDCILKKQRVCHGELHMSSMTSCSTLWSPRAAMDAGGDDSVQMRWCCGVPSMSATSVEPHRLSWKTMPVGSSEPGGSSAMSCESRAERLPWRLQRDAPTHCTLCLLAPRAGTTGLRVGVL